MDPQYMKTTLIITCDFSGLLKFTTNKLIDVKY